MVYYGLTRCVLARPRATPSPVSTELWARAFTFQQCFYTWAEDRAISRLFRGREDSTRSAGKEKDGKAAIPRLASWTGGPFTQLSLKSARKLPLPSVRELRLVLSGEGTMRSEGPRNSESFRATRL